MPLLNRILRPVSAMLLLLTSTALRLSAQTMPGEVVASQSLRAYHFVFVAYALAWILVLGWVVTVARRLARLARRLED